MTSLRRTGFTIKVLNLVLQTRMSFLTNLHKPTSAHSVGAVLPQEKENES